MRHPTTPLTLSAAVDFFIAAVISCMATQHSIEMRERNVSAAAPGAPMRMDPNAPNRNQIRPAPMQAPPSAPMQMGYHQQPYGQQQQQQQYPPQQQYHNQQQYPPQQQYHNQQYQQQQYC